MQPTSHFSHDKIKCTLDEWGKDNSRQVRGHELVDIIQDPRTKWEMVRGNYPWGRELEMFHWQKWKQCNYGYDWNVYLTYYEEKEDWFWKFSLIPPFQKDNLQAKYNKGVAHDVEHVFRATRDFANQVTGCHLRDLGHWNDWNNRSSLSSKMADAYCFQPDGHEAISYKRLFDFMELCRSWEGSPEPIIV